MRAILGSIVLHIQYNIVEELFVPSLSLHFNAMRNPVRKQHTRQNREKDLQELFFWGGGRNVRKQNSR